MAAKKKEPAEKPAKKERGFDLEADRARFRALTPEVLQRYRDLAQADIERTRALPSPPNLRYR